MPSKPKRKLQSQTRVQPYLDWWCSKCKKREPIQQELDASWSCNRCGTPSTYFDPGSTRRGGVYLIRMGKYYKIGKAKVFTQRFKQLNLIMPEEIVVVHRIYSDSPTELEAYWHKHFASKRLRGEWFDLNDEDVTRFKAHTGFTVEE